MGFCTRSSFFAPASGIFVCFFFSSCYFHIFFRPHFRFWARFRSPKKLENRECALQKPCSVLISYVSMREKVRVIFTPKNVWGSYLNFSSYLCKLLVYFFQFFTLQCVFKGIVCIKIHAWSMESIYIFVVYDMQSSIFLRSVFSAKKWVKNYS